MNRSLSSLIFFLCFDSFVIYKTAKGLSQRTVDSYEWVLRKWMEKIGDQPIGKIISADVLDYLTYLRTEVGLLFSSKPKGQRVMTFELHSLTCDQVDRVKYKRVLTFYFVYEQKRCPPVSPLSQFSLKIIKRITFNDEAA